MSEGRPRGRPRKHPRLTPDTAQRPPADSEAPFQGFELDQGVAPADKDEAFQARERLAAQLWEKEKHEYELADEEEHVEEETAAKPEETKEAAHGEEEQEESVEDKGAEPGKEREGVEAVTPEEEEDTLIINGTETKKSKKEIYEAGKRALQKDLAADRRLEEATRLLNEARAREELRLSQERDAAARARLQPVPDVAEREKMRKLYEALRYGEEDEGVVALEEITQMGRSATPQTDQLMTNMALMIERDRIEAEFVKPTEQGGYADIYPKQLGGQCDDPDVWAFFDVKINHALQSGKPNKLATYRETAELVRQRLGLKKVDTTQQHMAEKREKKRDIDVVKGVAVKSAATTKEEGILSDEEIHRQALNEARKHRGLL